MMMEIYSNELEIILKELKVDDFSVQDKIKGIRKEIEKQKQLVINNYQNTNTFFQQLKHKLD